MNEIYKNFIDLVESHKPRLYKALDYIWANPEIGYKEWKTSNYLKSEFEELGYVVTAAGDIPGFIAEYDSNRPGPKIAIMGELDALMCATHPDADPDTKAVHACGHFVQTTIMLGVAAAISQAMKDSNICGSVRFIAVPAEETIDLAFRESLIKQGIIKYVAGKIEFLRRGFFDDVDIAMMFHADNMENVLFRAIDGCDGCLTKHFVYEGVAAHAGGSPHLGVNALYAASLGLQACNSLRETFREADYVRWHPIITQAGVAANAIPAIASMDSYVRAASLDKMLETNQKINRCLGASAAALGANVLVSDKPGNLPFVNNADIISKMDEIVTDIFGPNQIAYTGWDTQSSDVGDICSLMPVIQPHCMGAVGTQHGEDYYIADREKAVINPTIVLLCLIYELLKDEGQLARKVVENYKPIYSSKEEYFKAIDCIECEKKLVEYQENGKIVISV